MIVSIMVFHIILLDMFKTSYIDRILSLNLYWKEKNY